MLGGKNKERALMESNQPVPTSPEDDSNDIS